jgi:AbrB family looped-hinge helix DNA binding protein
MSSGQKYIVGLQCITMAIEYATVKAKGQVVIPVDIRRRFQIGEGTRVAFLEEGGRLFVQPVTDEFIDGMKGVLAGRGLPERLERGRERDLK